jgi:hypothetical protein
MKAVACGTCVGHRVPPFGLVLIRDLLRPSVLLVRPSDDLVIDVGHVGDVVDDDPRVLEIAPEDVIHE